MDGWIYGLGGVGRGNSAYWSLVLLLWYFDFAFAGSFKGRRVIR